MASDLQYRSSDEALYACQKHWVDGFVEGRLSVQDAWHPPLEPKCPGAETGVSAIFFWFSILLLVGIFYLAAKVRGVFKELNKRENAVKDLINRLPQDFQYNAWQLYEYRKEHGFNRPGFDGHCPEQYAAHPLWGWLQKQHAAAIELINCLPQEMQDDARRHYYQLTEQPIADPPPAHSTGFDFHLTTVPPPSDTPTAPQDANVDSHYTGDKLQAQEQWRRETVRICVYAPGGWIEQSIDRYELTNDIDYPYVICDSGKEGLMAGMPYQRWCPGQRRFLSKEEAEPSRVRKDPPLMRFT